MFYRLKLQGVGLLWCTSTTPLNFKGNKFLNNQRCENCFKTIANSIDSFKKHQPLCLRRFQGMEYESEDSEVTILHDARDKPFLIPLEGRTIEVKSVPTVKKSMGL